VSVAFRTPHTPVSVARVCVHCALTQSCWHRICTARSAFQSPAEENRQWVLEVFLQRHWLPWGALEAAVIRCRLSSGTRKRPNSL
jgi:hypothetical protein